MSVPARPLAASPLDLAAVAAHFPILERRIRDRRLVWLDSAASSQKPQAVIDALVDYYANHHSNVHRAVHTLSAEATAMYEDARAKVARFIGAPEPAECIFVRGATEAINLVANAWAAPRLGPGDEVLVTRMEHHSNLVPWQMVCERTGARVVEAPIDARGALDMDALRARLNERTRLVAVAHVSNALGTHNPVREICDLARARGAIAVVDGAQAVPHMPVDVQQLGCDFYAFSGHKMYGPTGIGVLWGRRELLEASAPWQGGGSMIRSVSFEKTTFAGIPERFEAGTPNIADAVGLGAAIDWLESWGMDAVAAHEADLLRYGTERLLEIPEVRIVGTAEHKAGVLSFLVGDVHAHDTGTILDGEGIAVRAGHHCAQPVMDFFDVPATTRASLAVHNTRADLDALAAGVRRVLEIFG